MTADEDDVLRIEAAVARLFARVRRLLRGLGDEVAPGASPAAVALLRHLATEGPMTPGTLSARTGTDKTAVSRGLRELREAGLITVAPRADDARTSDVAATPDAADRMRSALAELARGTRARLDGWSADDLARFAELLDRFAASADDVDATHG